MNDRQTKENKVEEVVNLNGTEYTEKDFNEEQSYIIKQIRSCKDKAAHLMFELDQAKVAEQAFINAFMISMKTSEEEKAESSEDIAAEGK
jgi:NAD dependent epimerase/dehydratase family enzyme